MTPLSPEQKHSAVVREASHLRSQVEALETKLAAVTEAGNELAGLIRHEPGCPAPYGCTCTALCEVLARWNEVTK